MLISDFLDLVSRVGACHALSKYRHKLEEDGFVNLSNQELIALDFSNCRLEQINFSNSHLICINFDRSILQNVNFSNCLLSGCSFTGACLYNVNFDKTLLKEVNFNGCNFKMGSYKSGVLNFEQALGVATCIWANAHVTPEQKEFILSEIEKSIVI